MKILYVITKAERGGAQQNVLDLAIGMKEKGGTVMVAIGESSGWLVGELKEHGIQIEYVRLARTWNPFAFVNFLFDLFWIIKKNQPDITHFHSSHTLAGTWITRFCFRKTRSVATIHGLSILYPGAASFFSQTIYGWFLKCVLSKADQVICVCKFDAQELQKQILVKVRQLMVVYNGIDTPLYLSKEGARKTLGLPQDGIVVGILARYSFPKNLPYLIESFAKWNHSSAILCLIGQGRDEQSLKDLVYLLGIEDRVVFCAGDARLLKAFSCFVLSSRFEGFPYVLLEAALATIPIIATDVGGVTELIEQNKTGQLVSSGNVPELVSAFEWFVHHSEDVFVQAQQAKQRVESEFTKQNMIQKTESLYKTILTIE